MCCTGPRKAGLGAAYVAGFGWALERGYDVAGRDGRRRLARPGGAAAAARRAARRPTSSSGRAGCRAARSELAAAAGKLLSRGGNTYARLALRLPLRDATGGFRAYRRDVLEGLDARQRSPRRATASRSTWPGGRGAAGFRVVEVPITFVERARGESKMSSAIVAEALWRVTAWGFKSVGSRRRETNPRSVLATQDLS